MHSLWEVPVEETPAPARTAMLAGRGRVDGRVEKHGGAEGGLTRTHEQRESDGTLTNHSRTVATGGAERVTLHAPPQRDGWGGALWCV